ncbi:MAG: glycine zipper 2TM domain-containing protein [Burkholderiaceae bacterium]|nr:glycine zipper 2TM domain-containing protein [Burkholderiaceae bacterium]MDO9088626.1 glycine zipper 2TM domain-containing protein [Burkholderiaceae bacterium]
MNTSLRTSTQRVALAAILTMSLGLGACAGMSRSEQNTAIGAGAGAVGGAVLTGGSTLGVLGGAAIGGLIGNQVDKK